MNTTVLDIETLVREPDDPALRGYDPGHPWYYILGGRPLRVDEIKVPDENGEHNYLGIDLPADPGKRNLLLLKLKDEAEKELFADIAIYQKIVSQGKESLNSSDLMFGYGLETSLSLKVNHISYDKHRLAQIQAKLKSGPQRLLFE